MNKVFLVYYPDSFTDGCEPHVLRCGFTSFEKAEKYLKSKGGGKKYNSFSYDGKTTYFEWGRIQEVEIIG